MQRPEDSAWFGIGPFQLMIRHVNHRDVADADQLVEVRPRA